MIKMRLFVNKYEEITHSILSSRCQKHEVHVFAKVRLADVFFIDFKKTKGDLANYALKAHFDFVIYDKGFMPLFAVEIDGKYHFEDERQKRNDRMKNQLCRINSLPLLRINSRYLSRRYRTASLLDWLIDVWFLREAFFDAQDNGLVPMDEVFDPHSIWFTTDSEDVKPYDFNYHLQKKITQKYKDGMIPYYYPNTRIGIDKDNIYHGLGYLEVAPHKGIMVESAMTSKDFPVIESDLLESLIINQLYTKFLDGTYNLIPLSYIFEKYNGHKERYELRLAHTHCRTTFFAKEG
ncbi:MAG: DUF2726 domain-containing protein [Firmicutes bacterium]|nr:DUF2726 domain-containing protein [Bacillota bacterium]